jgi:uncharacterized protein (TIGR02145 family)
MKNLVNLSVFSILIFSSILYSCTKDDSGNIVKDADGNVYTSVTIGTQVWMVENLKTTKYRNGDPIPNVTDLHQWANITTGAYTWYDNDISNKNPHGALYNWFAVNDNRHIAPEGWHVPTYDDWAKLIEFLGGNDVAGGKLKENGFDYWESPNTGATDEKGFAGLGSGSATAFGTIKVFSSLNLFCAWWSTTECDNFQANKLHLHYDASYAWLETGIKIDGFSVRCIKD